MIKLNGVEIKPTIFPDKTSQVWQVDEKAFKRVSYIVWEFENEAELVHIAQLKDLMDAKGLVSNIFIPYMPYARQDKEISNSSTFAKQTFLKILNHLNFNTVTFLDEHSEMFNKSYRNKTPETEIEIAVRESKCTMVCFPDKGAYDRYGHYSGVNGLPRCSMSKERDQQTGYIQNLFLNELVDINGESVLIIDDICDGGMTFKLTAEKLLTLGAKEVNLYTTHGIYSKGIETLRESGINRIFNRKGEVE